MNYIKVEIDIPISTSKDEAKRIALYECLKNECIVMYHFNDILNIVDFKDVIKQVKKR